MLTIVSYFNKTAASSPRLWLHVSRSVCNLLREEWVFPPPEFDFSACVDKKKKKLLGEYITCILAGIYFGESPQAAGLGHTEISTADREFEHTH